MYYFSILFFGTKPKAWRKPWQRPPVRRRGPRATPESEPYCTEKTSDASSGILRLPEEACRFRNSQVSGDGTAAEAWAIRRNAGNLGSASIDAGEEKQG